MEKVKVSREVAEFIEDYEKSYMYEGWDNKMLSEHAYQYCSGSYLDESLKHTSPLQLSKILIYGYEVEQSPEEKLVKLFHDPATSYEYEDDAVIRMRLQTAFRHGVKTALKILDIEVKGINDNDD